MADRNILLALTVRAKDEATSILEKIGVVFATLGGKIADVVKSAVAFEFPSLSASAKDAEKLEMQMGQLRAAIDATGGAAGLTAEDIVKMSKALDEATLGSAEGFRNAALQLLTFKTVGVDAFERTLKAAQDLSSAGFGSVEGATVQLGKALENPIQGLTALTRVGVSFTEEQKKMIESFVRLGDVASAQNVILAAVEGQVQGVAAAAGGGLAGAVDLVGKRMTDLSETLGGVLLPIFTQLNLVWADVIGRVNETAERLAGPLKAASEQAGQALRTLGEGVAAFLSDALQKLGDWIANLDWASLQRGAETASAKIADLWQRFVDVGQAVKDFSDVVKVAFNGVQIAFNTVLTGVQALVSGFLTGLAEIEGAASKVGLGTLERAAELRARAEEWKAYAAESIAAIQRDASQAGAAFDSLTGKTDQAAAAQRALGDSLPAAELQAINKTLADYEGIAARANAALEKATRDQAAGKISAADYGVALLDAASAQEDLTAAQERQNALDTVAKIRAEKAERIAAVAAIEAQISAAEEEIKTLGQGDQARRRALQAERDLAEAKGDTAAATRLAKELVDDEITAANRLAEAKRKEADLRRQALESVRAQIAAGDDLNGNLAGQVGQLEAVAQATDYAAREAEANAEAMRLQADESTNLAERLNAEADRHQALREALEGEREQREQNIGTTEENTEANEKAAKSYTLMEDGASKAIRQLSELSKAAGDLAIQNIAVLRSGTQAASGLGELSAAAAEVSRQLDDVNATIESNRTVVSATTGLYGDLYQDMVRGANTARKAFLEQALTAENLITKMDRLAETGQFATSELAAGAVQAADQFSLLDQETLSRLRAAIDSANAKLAAMKEEAADARDALAKLNAEIAAEKGDDETARRLELEIEQRQRLGEVEGNLEAARAAGNRELIALYEKQRAKLLELFRLKERNLEADQRAAATTATKERNLEADQRAAATTATRDGPRSGGSSTTTTINNTFLIDPTKLADEEWVRRNVIPTLDKVGRLRG